MVKRKAAAAIDIGGTKTIAGLVEDSGRILAKKQIPTILSKDPFVHLKKCSEILEDSLRQAGLAPTELSGIGVSAPGLVDPSAGVLLQAPYAGWENVPIREWLISVWGSCDIQIENDVNACALGECFFGAGRDYESFLWVTVSTGIGGGLVIDGELYRGEHHIAGEIGHIVVDWDNGRKCGCGNKGCLEAHASGTAIGRLTKERIEQNGPHSELAAFFNSQNLEVNAANAATAAYQSIGDAVDIYQQAGADIGKAFSYAVNLLNPGAVIVGGGVSRSFDLMEPSIRKVLRSAVIGESNRDLPIVKTALGYDAAFLGASSLVLSQTEKN